MIGRSISDTSGLEKANFRVVAMKTVILAGGFGTRFSEETEVRPKPMVEIGGRPILWHILKLYAHFGHRDFLICLGYKGYLIKEYFINYFHHMSDLTVDLADGSVNVLGSQSEDWKVTLVDTGPHTLTGGRLKRIRHYIPNETFLMTYGDGVGDIDINTLLKFHRAHGRKATLTAVQPSGRFGALDVDNAGRVGTFVEKPVGDRAWINGGFFVLEPGVFDYIEGDSTMWEREPLEQLAADGQLMAYRHDHFWKAMDTLRDKKELEELWSAGRAPWRVW